MSDRHINVLMVMPSSTVNSVELKVSGNYRRIVELIRRASNYHISYMAVEHTPLKSLDETIPNYRTFTLKECQNRNYVLYTVITLMRALFLAFKIRKSRIKIDLVLAPDTIPLWVLTAFIISKVLKIPCVVVVQLLPSWLIESTEANISAFYIYFRRHKGHLKGLTYALLSYIFVKILLHCHLIFSSKAYCEIFQKITKCTSDNFFINRYACGISVPNIHPIKTTKKKIDAIFIGTHDERKGIFDLIEVWSNVVSLKPDALLVTCGYISEKVKNRLLKEIISKGLSKNIQILGPVADDYRKAELMTSSKLFILLSRNESFSLVIGEAMALGLPVVAYGLPVLKEIWECPAFFAEPVKNVNKVANTVLKILSMDVPQYRRLSHIAKKHATRYSWNSAIMKETIIYREILKRS